MEQEKQLSFDEFERDWKRKHKSSIPRRTGVSSAREFFWIGFWLVVATGAAIFSAAHTIPAAELTILKDVASRAQLAITAFIIVELVIFGAAAGRREIPWLKWLLIGAVLVALAGNISSSIRAVYENGGDLINQFGGVLLAIIAPLTALAAGEVLHIQLDKRNEKLRIANEDFDAKNKDISSKILQAFTKYEKSFQVSRNFMKSGEAETVHETSRSPVKPRVKIHEIAEIIYENGDGKLSASEMMDKYGISLGSTTKIREMLKDRNSNGFANGNGVH